MKAMVVRSPRNPLVLEERETPRPGAGQVRIKVHACGVCHSDNFVTEGLWPGLVLPRVPGHEVAGVVDAVGEGARRFKPGDRVGIGWYGGHDGTCEACRKGRFLHCRNGSITGFTFDGGYEEQLVAPEAALAPIPEGMDLAEAAPLLGGAKVILATAPHARAISALVPALGLDSCLLVVAAPFEPIQVSAADLIGRDARIQGWASGTSVDSADALAFADAHSIRPMIEKFPLSEAGRAVEAMMKGTVRFRAVLEVGSR
jgi:D-arabinose 1-dehydrogenase-like Zn-dependent alcohol dehydrogenase